MNDIGHFCGNKVIRTASDYCYNQRCRNITGNKLNYETIKGYISTGLSIIEVWYRVASRKSQFIT